MPADPRMLKKIPLFMSMDDEEREAIAAIMDEMPFKAGQVIFSAEETGGTFFIVQAGQVELSIIDDDGEKLVLEILESGDFFGEMSLLDGGTRSATATAIQRTETLVLDRREFLDLLMQRPHMAQDVLVSQAKRIRRTDNLLRRRVSRNPNEAIEERETLGDRVADGVARFGGSWRFIFAFAAIQAPVIMMSQNRQDAKDRIRSELDYQVNLKAELGVSTLLHKTDLINDMLENIDSKLARV